MDFVAQDRRPLDGLLVDKSKRRSDKFTFDNNNSVESKKRLSFNGKIQILMEERAFGNLKGEKERPPVGSMKRELQDTSIIRVAADSYSAKPTKSKLPLSLSLSLPSRPNKTYNSFDDALLPGSTSPQIRKTIPRSLSGPLVYSSYYQTLYENGKEETRESNSLIRSKDRAIKQRRASLKNLKKSQEEKETSLYQGTVSDVSQDQRVDSARSRADTFGSIEDAPSSLVEVLLKNFNSETKLCGQLLQDETDGNTERKRSIVKRNPEQRMEEAEAEAEGEDSATPKKDSEKVKRRRRLNKNLSLSDGGRRRRDDKDAEERQQNEQQAKGTSIESLKKDSNKDPGEGNERSETSNRRMRRSISSRKLTDKKPLEKIRRVGSERKLKVKRFSLPDNDSVKDNEQGKPTSADRVTEKLPQRYEGVPDKKQKGTNCRDLFESADEKINLEDRQEKHRTEHLRVLLVEDQETVSKRSRLKNEALRSEVQENILGTDNGMPLAANEEETPTQEIENNLKKKTGDSWKKCHDELKEKHKERFQKQAQAVKKKKKMKDNWKKTHAEVRKESPSVRKKRTAVLQKKEKVSNELHILCLLICK